MNIQIIRPIRTEIRDNLRNAATLAKWDALHKEATERLAARLREYEVPALHWAPAQDVCVIYRLPRARQTETAGGLIIPDIAQYEAVPHSVGLLIWAGAEASEVLENHGVLPGDFVKFARYAGEEEDSERVEAAIQERAKTLATKAAQQGVSPAAATEIIDRELQKIRDEEAEKRKLMELKACFIHGSIDLLDRLFGEHPTMRMVRYVESNDGISHIITPV